MKLWKAILLTIGIIIILAILPATASRPIGYAVVFISALWILSDAKKIHPERYDSKMGFDSTSLFILTIIFWFILFPGYLGLRYRIKNNLVPLRDKFKQ